VDFCLLFDWLFAFASDRLRRSKRRSETGATKIKRPPSPPFVGASRKRPPHQIETWAKSVDLARRIRHLHLAI
jgi:hypothetical protein